MWSLIDRIGVEDGLVTLGGRVETWFERSQARAEAFDAGARKVRLDLRSTTGRRLTFP